MIIIRPAHTHLNHSFSPLRLQQNFKFKIKDANLKLYLRLKSLTCCWRKTIFSSLVSNYVFKIITSPPVFINTFPKSIYKYTCKKYLPYLFVSEVRVRDDLRREVLLPARWQFNRTQWVKSFKWYWIYRNQIQLDTIGKIL